MQTTRVHVSIGLVKPLRIAGLIGAAVATTWAMQDAAAPVAQAASCPDAQVLFARGTDEPVGFGEPGEAFVDALQSRVSPKYVQAYAVDYPASLDFKRAVDGISDTRAHVMSTVANCPDTKIVLGGYSQGAAIMGFITANAVPDGVTMANLPSPMPSDVANHIAAVALLGKPSPRFMKAINEPSIAIGAPYRDKTIDLCVTNDLICASSGRSFAAHTTYVDTGMVDQAVTFVADKLQKSWAADRPVLPPATGPLPGPAPASPSPQLQLAAPATPLNPAGPTQHLPTTPAAPNPAPAPSPLA